jgi:Ca2+-binding RTX toxin-like protein
MEGYLTPGRRIAAAAALLGAGLALMAANPVDALAGTLSRSGSVVTYSAGAQVNDVAVAQNTLANGQKSVAVADPAGVALGAGCTEVSPTAGRCDLSSLTEVRVLVGGGNDDVRVVASSPVSVPMYIEGGPGLDHLEGGTAGDTIEGGDAADELDGNAGSDALHGRFGEDELIGDLGHDVLDAGQHEDALFGGEGDDDLIGYTADDDLYGGNGADELDGGAGRDYLDGDAGTDSYQGGTEADTLYTVDDRNENVDCGGGIFSGADTATLNTGDFILFDSCENHTFVPPTS